MDFFQICWSVVKYLTSKFWVKFVYNQYLRNHPIMKATLQANKARMESVEYVTEHIWTGYLNKMYFAETPNQSCLRYNSIYCRQ